MLQAFGAYPIKFETNSSGWFPGHIANVINMFRMATEYFPLNRQKLVNKPA